MSVCIYREGGFEPVWGKLLEVSSCDGDIPEGWVDHPYKLEIFDSEEAKEYRAENGKKSKKAKKEEVKDEPEGD